ncbi:TPA: aspartate ammonia-lyase [Bacillus mycoides]|uniref:Thoeris anti-defense 2-like domain-containing protein n=1 Tax=Bacillus cereus VD021 TaxID=1053224 RepID=R8H2J5_BACCE|nr:hypothetical protein IIC_05300 [Bacillus cereus VD021]HDR7595140.1 aspartate ammonia-lyase [Bacillus mycoides]
MNIQEATQRAINNRRYIMRESWRSSMIKIRPTDSYDMCKLYPLDELHPSAIEPRRAWNPFAEDLIATDWIVVD